MRYLGDEINDSKLWVEQKLLWLLGAGLLTLFLSLLLRVYESHTAAWYAKRLAELEEDVNIVS